MYGDLCRGVGGVMDGSVVILPENCSGRLTIAKIDPKTIGQFTGLLDAKGIEIYEGDIVKVDNWFTSEVFYHEGLCAFVVDNAGKQMINLLQDFKEVEVIGNKYDNPELIKELID